MSDVSPYGVTQNADEARITANEMVGERISPMPGNALVGSPALFSTAPYVPPMTSGRRTGRLGKCKGKDDTCNARPVGGTDLCIFHSPGQARRDRLDVDESPTVA